MDRILESLLTSLGALGVPLACFQNGLVIWDMKSWGPITSDCSRQVVALIKMEAGERKRQRES